MTKPPRPGSRKASVFEKYFAEGAEAAIAIGVGLGLAANTVKSWINTWIKGNANGDSPAAPETKKGRMVTKSTVTVTYDPEREAYLVDEGPEVSEIRWADTGQYQFISNTHLKK